MNGKQNTTFQFLFQIDPYENYAATFKLTITQRQYVDLSN